MEYIGKISVQVTCKIIFIGNCFWLAWGSYCCLTPTQQFFKLYHDEDKYIWDGDDKVHFVLEQQP
jgi:hypothetical protein